MRDVRVGRFASLDLNAAPALFVITSVLMWAFFAALGSIFFHVGIKSVVAGGLVLTVAHVASEVFHQMGHARAARQVGHPMTGVRLMGIIGISIYPAGEVELTPDQHLHRAWGGPPASFALTIAGGAVAWITWQVAPHYAWVPLVFFLDNLFFFALGAFAPLGFTDGSTIIHWTRKRAQLKEL